ncbi:MAG TPA: iron-sulfur cluster assembly accessory protein [Candidatus Kapabacteria bacterium]|nr:iron-sulfur cluster assembly accessory protein [Candidatus Kapabacteria bacterium]
MSILISELETEKLQTGILGAEGQDSILITRRALDKISHIRQENSISEEYSLRLGAQSGGCSGMNYLLGFDAETNDYDKLLNVDDLNIVVDRSSLFYLMGVTLDYVSDEYGTGFIFNNPNKANSCGCSCGCGDHDH